MRLVTFAAFSPDTPFQSTHPVWGATSSTPSSFVLSVISIHAPRAGCDRPHGVYLNHGKDFNPRTPCGVRPAPFRKPRRRMLNFNPRTPCGVRPGTGDAVPDHQDFNPRTPCGVRLWTRLHSRSVTCISIHAPRAGCDSDPASRPSHRAHFNPRTPCGVRPLQCAQQLDLRVISIHVPRAGCDPATLSTRSPCPHFNPRTPCGVRPSAIILSRSCPRYFNPRTPCGVRRQI